MDDATGQLLISDRLCRLFGRLIEFYFLDRKSFQVSRDAEGAFVLSRIGKFEKNVLTLVPGAFLSQAIPILAFPLMARLYKPGDFGTMSLFFHLTMIFVIFSTLRLEVAVFYSRDKSESQKIVNAILSWAFWFSLISLPLFYILKDFIAGLLNNSNLENLIIFLPISIFLTALYQLFLVWLNYCNDYRGLSFNRGLRSSFEIGLKLLLSPFGYFGMVFGGLLGLFCSDLHLLSRAKKFFQQSLFAATAKKEIIKKYSHLPLYQIPGSLISALNLALPALCISHWTSQEFLGLYVVANRIAHIPVNSLGNAIGEVFRSDAAEELLNGGVFTQSYKKTFLKLFAVSFIVFSFGYVLCPYVFPLFLGGKWGGVDLLFQALCPMFAVQFIARPLSHSLDIAQRQQLNLMWQLVTLFVIGGVLYLVLSSEMSREKQVLCFSLAYSFCYLFSIVLTFWSSFHPLKKQRKDEEL